MPRHTSRLPFTLKALAAQTRLDLDGEVALPLGSAARLNIELTGERLDTLSELARVELRAWGPWSLRGPLSKTPAGYELRELQLRVGDSRLGGGRLDISGPRLRLNLHVAAPRIQLDDFPLPRRLADAGDVGDTRDTPPRGPAAATACAWRPAGLRGAPNSC